MAAFLVLGSGGREHILCWKFAQSPRVTRIYCCPGNGGTAVESKTQNIDINWEDREQLLDFIAAHRIRVTLIGPEAPLVAGLADDINRAGHFCIGPGAAGAQLEGSKIFCKDFLRRHKIPTAAATSFEDYQQASAYLHTASFPCVVKFDGLAGGKGVTVARTHAAAQQALDDLYIGGKFGATKCGVLIEEFLSGEELSYIVFAHGADYVPLLSSQDHKARDDGDTGPNTGGMGAYAPVPWGEEMATTLQRDIIEPTLRGLEQEGIFYCGFLYAGLMVQEGRAQVLEYNCRLGDPEAEALLFCLQSDLAAFLLKLAAAERPESWRFDWLAQPALTVIMAAAGYPGAYDVGHPIDGLGSVTEATADAKVFHCGTRYGDGEWFTHGGRVLAVTARAPTHKAAQQRAYRVARRINWRRAWYRSDIGHRVLET